MPIKSHIPLGTLEKCQSLGLNPAEFATCSKPGGSESVGCSQYDKCPWRNGPFNLGARIVKKGANGTTTMRRVLGCHATIKLEEYLRDNKKGFVQVMAREGEEFAVTEKVKDPPNPSQPGSVTWSMGEVKGVIRPHETFESVYSTNVELAKVQRMLDESERSRDMMEIAGVEPGPIRIMEISHKKAVDERTDGEPKPVVGSGGVRADAGAPARGDSNVGRRSG